MVEKKHAVDEQNGQVYKVPDNHIPVEDHVRSTLIKRFTKQPIACKWVGCRKTEEAQQHFSRAMLKAANLSNLLIRVRVDVFIYLFFFFGIFPMYCWVERAGS